MNPLPGANGFVSFCTCFRQRRASGASHLLTDCRHRLHVNIFDKLAQQFTLPSGYFDLPKVEKPSWPGQAELEFKYEASPFAFWITRRSDPGSAPIFDTRLTSLPSTPIIPATTSDPSLAFDAFPLVFEHRYLQVPLDFFHRSDMFTSPP
jgi:alpha-glucosidase